VIGASDARGEEVKDRPVSPVDVIGSVYELLGLDTTTKLPNPDGLDIGLVPAAPEGIRTDGRLKEIM
jgi:hypothetical protein